MATVQRTLQRTELRILAILGVPTFALALAITTVSTYRWTWLVCGAAILVSIPVMAPVRDEPRAG